MNDASPDRNVDQIRDILFGGQMRDYERRFLDLSQRLESESQRLHSDLDKRLGQLEKRVDDQFDKLTKQLRQEIADRSAGIDDLETRMQQGPAHLARRNCRVGCRRWNLWRSHQTSVSARPWLNCIAD